MATQTLPDDPAALKDIILHLQSKINFLEEQFRLARHKQFAASTEASPGQGEQTQVAHFALLPFYEAPPDNNYTLFLLPVCHG